MNSLALWMPPEEDFHRWRELTNNDFTLAEYKEQIDALAKSAEDMGYQVVVVRWTVERMREALQARGFENTTENRAVLISEAGADQEINNDEC